MISYQRKIRLKDLEIYLLFKDSTSMGYLIIEDLRRPIGKEELELYPYKQMDVEDIETYRNVIKVDILSDESLNDDDKEIFREFALDLVDRKDFCAIKINYTIDEQLFEDFPLDLEMEDYKKMLMAINSDHDISGLDLDKLVYLSQE